MIRVPISGTKTELREALSAAASRLESAGWTCVMNSDGSVSAVCRHGSAGYLDLLESDGRGTGSALVASAPGATCLCAQGLTAALQALPFTVTEMAATRLQMPLTASAANWLSVDGDRPLEGVGAICTIHHQRDFVVMIESAIELGLDPNDILVIDKEYEYKHQHRVDGHLKHALGVSVATYSEMESAVGEFLNEMGKKWKRVVLIDDGGYLLPLIRSSMSDEALNFILGVVEQTASGIFALRPFLPDLRVPLFNVAESDLKLTVEARGVAAAGIRSLRAVLPDVHWNGRRALVAGYGRIGRAVAHELARESVRVGVFDTSYAALVTAQEDGFAAFDDLGIAVREWIPNLFCGATGRARFGSEIIDNLSSDCVLVSFTSRDYEFDKAYLASRASSEISLDGVGRRYLIETNDGVRKLLLVADGYPINFYNAESMPNEQSDLVLASMLLGAVEIIRRRSSFEIGLNRDLSNEILNRHEILRRYFELRRASPLIP